MKRSATGFIWGLIIIALGVLIGAKAFGADFDIFFDGWWTLFIIIPSAVGLCERGNRTGSAIGLAIGVMLLLSAQGFMPWNMFGKLIVAVIFVIIGLKLIFDEGRKNKNIDFNQNKNGTDSTYTYTYDSTNANNTSNSNNNNENFNSGSSNQYDSNITAIFSGKNMNYNGQYFGGVAATAVFGGIDLNLKNAIIDKDVIIDVTAIFGGIDIYVPSNVRVVVNCTAILGGVDNKTVTPSMAEGMNMPTIYVNGAC
ncbi:LiaF transmembrane domain-containing protein, partial [Anaerosporobacter sp.]